ncbi:LamG-like jellyroll fold domain-containing protein, partial [Streptomyces sp. NPDC006356]
MAPPLSRRSLLQAAALAAATPAIGYPATGRASAAVQEAQAVTAIPAGWSVQPFALDDVALRPGLFADKRQLMLDHARGYDVNRLLQVFRANAGLSTGGAVAPGGWEGLDGEANGNLRGHYTGHFLTMLSQAYAGTGEQVFVDRIRTMVGALTEVRAALRKDPAVLSVGGRFGTAAENVRGSYQYVDLPAAVLGGASAITLSAWVKPTHAGNWARIFDFGNNNTRYMYLAARNASGVPRFALTTNGPGGEQGIDGTAPLPLDQWSHLAVTIAGGTGTLYVNGTAVARNTAMTLTPAALGTLAHNWLGRSNFDTDPVFAGAYDE